MSLLLNDKSYISVYKFFVIFLICKFLFCSVSGLFTLLVVSFDIQMYFFIALILYAITKKPLPNPRSQKFTPMFSSRIYVNFTLTIKSHIHLNYFLCVVWGRATHSIFCLWKSNCSSNIYFVYPFVLFFDQSSSEDPYSIFREWKRRRVGERKINIDVRETQGLVTSPTCPKMLVYGPAL